MKRIIIMRIQLFIFALVWIVLSAIEDLSQDIISFPLQLHGNDGSITTHAFNFRLNDPTLDLVVEDFCIEHSLLTDFCKYLYDKVLEFRHAKIREKMIPMLQNSDLSNADLAELDQLVPNSHLSRFPGAVYAELQRYVHAENYNGSLLEVEDSIHHFLAEDFAGAVPKRVCIIHSTSFEGNSNSNRILKKMLEQLHESNLAAELDKLIVLNYGGDVEGKIKKLYSNVTWVQVHRDTSYFECPSLRILHKLAILFENSTRSSNKASSPAVPLAGYPIDTDVEADGGTHFLYLHTKGVSYTQQYQQIEDWRDMMMFHLVQRHRSCFHLLQSGEFDVVGLNYKTHPRRMLSGNFWWSTARHLARLPELRYEGCGKYEAELWLLDAPVAAGSGQQQQGADSPVRLYTPYMTNVDHAKVEHPLSCYARPHQRRLPQDGSGGSGSSINRNAALCGEEIRSMRRKCFELI